MLFRENGVFRGRSTSQNVKSSIKSIGVIAPDVISGKSSRGSIIKKIQKKDY